MNRELKFRAWLHMQEEMIYANIFGAGEKFAGRDCDIMQYTGLKDKNGREIYEGDVIDYAFRTKDSNERFISKVFWDEYMWLTDEHSINRINDVEIIGNIYENKNLLK